MIGCSSSAATASFWICSNSSVSISLHSSSINLHLPDLIPSSQFQVLYHYKIFYTVYYSQESFPRSIKPPTTSMEPIRNLISSTFSFRLFSMFFDLLFVSVCCKCGADQEAAESTLTRISAKISLCLHQGPAHSQTQRNPETVHHSQTGCNPKSSVISKPFYILQICKITGK